MHQINSSSVAPFHAKTGMPLAATAAAAASCVEKALQLAHWTWNWIKVKNQGDEHEGTREFFFNRGRQKFWIFNNAMLAWSYGYEKRLWQKEHQLPQHPMQWAFRWGQQSEQSCAYNQQFSRLSVVWWRRTSSSASSNQASHSKRYRSTCVPSQRGRYRLQGKHFAISLKCDHGKFRRPRPEEGRISISQWLESSGGN